MGVKARADEGVVWPIRRLGQRRDQYFQKIGRLPGLSEAGLRGTQPVHQLSDPDSAGVITESVRDGEKFLESQRRKRFREPDSHAGSSEHQWAV